MLYLQADCSRILNIPDSGAPQRKDGVVLYIPNSFPAAEVRIRSPPRPMQSALVIPAYSGSFPFWACILPSLPHVWGSRGGSPEHGCKHFFTAQVSQDKESLVVFWVPFFRQAVNHDWTCRKGGIPQGCWRGSLRTCQG